MDSSSIKLINHLDGTVTRTGYCDCGTPLYKKNLTTNQIEIRVPNDRQVRLYTLIEPAGNPSQLTLTCPACGNRHIIGHIAEQVALEDSIVISPAVVE